MRSPALVLGLALLCIGCAPRLPNQEDFGGDQWGFPEASSASGRVVLMRVWEGEEPPSFGHHGASMGEAPKLIAFDRFAGTEREIEELVAVAPDREHMVVLDEGEAWLIDDRSGSWSSLTDVDMQADANRCWRPRQAAFSESGKRVSWILSGSKAMRVRDLKSGDEWDVHSSERVWRGWPDDRGKGVLVEVPADATEWPVQGTSCACVWCGRFAMMSSTFGWSGPSFEIVAVDENGERSEGEPLEGHEPIHGETSSGCKLVAARGQGEALERGPWRWDCGKK